MEQGEVVGRFLRPADQDTAEAVQPGVRTLDNPASRLCSDVALGPGLLATAAQMQGKGECLGQGSRLVIVEALVEAEMLRTATARPGPLDGDRFQGLAHQLVVIAVRAIDDGTERHAAAISGARAFDPALSAICWIGAGFFPHPAALSPSPHPMPATSSRCRPGHHRPAGLHARTPRTRRPESIPENAGAPRRTSRYLSPSARSTGIPSAARRRSRPSPRGPAHADCGSPTGAWAEVAAAFPSRPTMRPASANHHRERAASSSSVHPSPCLRYGQPQSHCLPGWVLSRIHSPYAP